MVVRYACTHICTCVCMHTHIRTHIEILISDNNWTYYLIMVEFLAHASCNDRDRIINICITSSIQHFFVLGAFKILSCSYYKIYTISHSPYCALAWDLLFFAVPIFFFATTQFHHLSSHASLWYSVLYLCMISSYGFYIQRWSISLRCQPLGSWGRKDHL